MSDLTGEANMSEAELANREAALDAEFAAQIHDQVRSFLVAVREIARLGDLSTAVPLLLLEVSQLMLAGGRLGAVDDIVPREQYETDSGPDQDLDELRERLADVLEGL